MQATREISGFFFLFSAFDSPRMRRLSRFPRICRAYSEDFPPGALTARIRATGLQFSTQSNYNHHIHYIVYENRLTSRRNARSCKRCDILFLSSRLRPSFRQARFYEFYALGISLREDKQNTNAVNSRECKMYTNLEQHAHRSGIPFDLCARILRVACVYCYCVYVPHTCLQNCVYVCAPYAFRMGGKPTGRSFGSCNFGLIHPSPPLPPSSQKTIMQLRSLVLVDSRSSYSH